MLTLELDEENLRKAWGGSSEYWFSTKDYSVRDVVEIIDYNSVEETSKASYLISLGYIPYFAVSDEEVMYSFIQTITNEKLKAVVEANSAHPVPSWIEFDAEKLTAKISQLPNREDIDLDVEEHLIVELYSK